MAFGDILSFLRSRLSAGQVLTRSARGIVGVDPSALTPAGHFLPATTNSHDLGATGTTWRRIYLGGYAVVPTIGASAAQQHALPAVTSSTLAVLGAAQTWTGVQTFNAAVAMDSTDSSGAPGAATINKPAGRSAVALGAAGVVITNSLVTANSKVFVQLRSADTTLLYVTVTSAAGSFAVTGNAAATAAVVFDWFVVN